MATTRSIALSGFSRTDEDSFRSLFEAANHTSGGSFRLGAEAEADVLIIDVDSIYGQMGLMQARSSGKTLVALTSGTRADADLLLQRPLEAKSIQMLLGALAQPGHSRSQAAPRPQPEPRPASPSPGPTEAPAAQSPTAVEAPKPSSQSGTPPVAAAEPPQPSMPEPARPRPRSLFELLQPGVLPGPVSLQREGAPALVLEPGERVYFGGASLKPLLPYVEGPLGEHEANPLTPNALAALEKELGGRQPMMRLIWLAALNAGGGQLIGFSPETRFKLGKWPQIEREFPKHFRIATVMMKAPATVDEIAATSGASREEVCDLLNAYLATGFAEPEQTPSTAAAETARTGLLDRLRSLRG